MGLRNVSFLQTRLSVDLENEFYEYLRLGYRDQTSHIRGDCPDIYNCVSFFQVVPLSSHTGEDVFNACIDKYIDNIIEWILT